MRVDLCYGANLDCFVFEVASFVDKLREIEKS